MAGIIDTWRGAWVPSVAYERGSFVSHSNGSSYFAASNAAAGVDPAKGGPWVYVSYHSPGIIEVWRGVWSATHTYAYGDIVVRPNGSAYLAVQTPPVGQEPEDGDPWVPLDARPLGQTDPAGDLSPNGAAIDLFGPELSLFDQISTSDATVQQGFAFDNRDGTLYSCQIIGGGQQLAGESAPVPYAERVRSGDLVFSKISRSGALQGRMWIRKSGHGTALGVEESSDGGVWLWTGAAALEAGGRGFASKIARVPFTDQAVLDSADTDQYDPFPGSRSVDCTIDPLTNRLMYRSNISGFRKYYLYRLADVKNRAFSQPIAEQYEPLADPTYLQGFCSADSSFYVYDGQAGGTITLRRVDWASGTVTQSALMSYGSSLTYREPEGLAVRLPDRSTPDRFQLCFGIVSGSFADPKLNVAYLETGMALPGWTLLPYNQTLYEPTGESFVPQYRAESGRVWLRFRLRRIDGTPWPNQATVLTLPEWIRPRTFQGISGQVSAVGNTLATSAMTVRYDINQTNGNIILADGRSLTSWVGSSDGYWL